MRENLGAVPSDSDLGRRYLAELAGQEDQIQTLADEIATATADRNRARQALEAFVGNLTL
ncbi:MAG: hypothetical protein AAF220_05360 [Pseudomonadota bacterium]